MFAAKKCLVEKLFGRSSICEATSWGGIHGGRDPPQSETSNQIK